jgi:ATP-binding cassette subfamily C (CFTR/MRP) protein 1
MNLLFRIVELDSGSIEIDGIDIARLGLKQLRSAISMLPQDPTLCESTVCFGTRYLFTCELS